MSGFLESKWKWIVVGAVVLMGYLLFFRWTSSAQLEKRQAALISGMEDNRWRTCEKRISEEYSDRWGWKRHDLRLVFQDVRSQFLLLSITLEDQEWDVAGKRATLKARVRLGGQPIGFGGAIVDLVNRDPTPVFFLWEKESWTPWSWKLVRMDVEVEISESYQPGDLVKARRGQF